MYAALAPESSLSTHPHISVSGSGLTTISYSLLSAAQNTISLTSPGVIVSNLVIFPGIISITYGVSSSLKTVYLPNDIYITVDGKWIIF